MAPLFGSFIISQLRGAVIIQKKFGQPLEKKNHFFFWHLQYFYKWRPGTISCKIVKIKCGFGLCPVVGVSVCERKWCRSSAPKCLPFYLWAARHSFDSIYDNIINVRVHRCKKSCRNEICVRWWLVIPASIHRIYIYHLLQRRCVKKKRLLNLFLMCVHGLSD